MASPSSTRDDRGRSPWEKAEDKKRWALLAGVAVIISTLSLAVIHAGLKDTILGSDRVLSLAAALMFGPLEWLSKILGATWGEEFIREHSYAACFASGPIWAIHFKIADSIDERLNWLDRVQERFFAAYNTDVLSKISRAKALDPLWGQAEGLVWLPPRGERLAAWTALGQFVSREAGDGRMHWHGRPRVAGDFKEFAFRWSLLVGLPGAGKSRMAMEFARHLAKSDIIEGDQWRHRWGNAKISTREYVRRIVPWAARHRFDPWDAGWIRPEPMSSATSRPAGRAKKIAPSYFDKLARWKPRRPTFLLLDDPRPGDSQRVIETLEANHEKFRFPVRLLIVDQALPRELNLSPNDSVDLEKHLTPGAARWETDVACFDGAVVVLDAASRLNERDICAMAKALRDRAEKVGLAGPMWRGEPDPLAASLVYRTRGNPLLVELALRRMLAGASIDDIDEKSLLADQVARIERIILAMELGGAATENHLRALASATLCGPLPGQEPSSGLVLVQGKHPMIAAFGELETKVWLGLFNLDHAMPDQIFAPVRPEMIGDAFARQVLEKYCRLPGQRQTIVAAAWRTDTLGVLRTLSRVGRYDDALARALALDPPDDVAVEKARLALAYAAIAIQVPRDAWEVGLAGDSAVALEASLAWIGRLFDSDVSLVLAELTKMMGPSTRLTVVRAWEGMVCLSAAIVKRLSGLQPGQKEEILETAHVFLRGMRRVREDGAPNFRNHDIVCRAAGKVVEAIGESMETDSAGLRQWVNDLVAEISHWVEMSMPSYAEIVRLLDALAVPPLAGQESLELQRVRALVNLSYAQSNHDDVLGCQSSAARLDAIIDPKFTGKEEFELQRAMALVNLSYAQSDHGDVLGCQSSAARLDAIIDPSFTGKEEFELLRAKAIVNLSKARSDHGDVPGCQSAVQRLGEIIDPNFAGKEPFELLRAMALVNLSFGQSNHKDEAGCQSSVAWLDAIIDPEFTGKEPFELERAKAVANLSAAQRDVPICQSSIARLDGIIDPKFTGKREFELLRAKALVNLSVTQASHGDVSGCQISAARLDAIIDPKFTGKEEFEVLRAQVIVNLSYAQSNHGDVLGCQSSAARLDAIIDPRFTGKEAFELYRAAVVVNLSVAQGNQGDIPNCRSSAARLDGIIDPPFNGKEAFELQRSKMVVNLSKAQSDHGDLSGCQISAARLDGIIDPQFTGKEEFELCRAMVIVNLSYAQGARGDVLGCRSSVERLDRIIDPNFTGRERFEAQRVKAAMNRPEC